MHFVEHRAPRGGIGVVAKSDAVGLIHKSFLVLTIDCRESAVKPLHNACRSETQAARFRDGEQCDAAICRWNSLTPDRAAVERSACLLPGMCATPASDVGDAECRDQVQIERAAVQWGIGPAMRARRSGVRQGCAIQLHLALKICQNCATPFTDTVCAYTNRRKSAKAALKGTCVWYNAGNQGFRRARAAEAEFFDKRSREFFAGAMAIVAGACAGGEKLGYFTGNRDFGLIGEIEVASSPL